MLTCPNISLWRQFRVIDGLKALTERAGRELRATRETVRKHTVETAGELNPQDAQITWLAQDERVKPDISTQLSIGSLPARWTSFGHTYPGRPEQVQRVRADLRVILNGCPIADETILVASELAANAVTHSGSRQPGGRFIVRAEVRPGDYAWVEIEDQGDIWADHDPQDSRPHGLDIVQAIAGDGNWGIDGDASFGHVAWARLDWPGC